MDAHISHSRVSGRARAPPSKSYTHRAILAAGYADSTVVQGPLDSADTRATIRAVEAYGGAVKRREREGTLTLEIDGFDGYPQVPADIVDCGNSGTTMRLVTATAALGGGLTVLTGDGSLRSRPQGPLLEALESLGGQAISTRDNGQAPLVVGGQISGGSVSIPGDVSSQYITALLMAGGVTTDGIEIELETVLKSAPYVDITMEVLEAFGIKATPLENGFRVGGRQSYTPIGDAYHVPGDFSSISYLLAAGVLAAEDNESVVVEGAYPSAQGDSAIIEILAQMGATIDWDTEAGTITVGRTPLSGIKVSVADTPDLLPTIAVLGAAADGTTRITDCEHVRYKETDRVRAMAAELETLGATVEEEVDQLVIHGGDTTLAGATVDGRADHRIVMALTVAGLVAKGETTVVGAEHVDVSFPHFFETMDALGMSGERVK
jgi:3-phosphoshikimate 1-carboxyvinyltransferase